MADPPRVTPAAAPPRLIIWTVGEARLEAELQEWFTNILANFHARLEFQVRHLTKEEDPPSGDVHIVIGAVATRTWSRARHVTPKGPPPLRSADWPWGFPWLSSSHRAVVEEANSQLTYVLHALSTTCLSHPAARIIFLHPEDLGAAELGRPASAWQLPAVRDLARRHGLLRLALYQCEFGPALRPGPMGMLTSEPLRDKRLAKGWPRFQNGGGHQYAGPLTARCNCHSGHQLRSTMSTDELQAARDGTLQSHFANWLCKSLLEEHLEKFSAGHLRSGGTPARSNSLYTDHLDTEGATDSEGDVTWHEDEVSDFDCGFTGLDQYQQNEDIAYDQTASTAAQRAADIDGEFMEDVINSTAAEQAADFNRRRKELSNDLGGGANSAYFSNQNCPRVYGWRP